MKLREIIKPLRKEEYLRKPLNAPLFLDGLK